MPQIWLAISTRLVADSTLTGLLSNGANSLYYGDHPPRQGTANAYPYITYTTEETASDPHQDAIVLRRVVRVNIYLARRSTSATLDSVSVAASILTRIEGDWFEQSTRVPTYGLDRHLLVLSGSTGWTAGTMTMLTSGEEHGDDHLHYWIEFEVHSTRRIP